MTTSSNHIAPDYELYLTRGMVETTAPAAKRVQSCYQLFWFMEGGGVLTIDSREYPIEAGHMYFVSPERDAVVPPTLPVHYWLAFPAVFLEDDDKEYVVDVYKLFNIIGEARYYAVPAAEAAVLEQIAALLFIENSRAVKSFLIQKIYLKAFLAQLIRSHLYLFTLQDVQEKRALQFVQLLHAHYRVHKDVSFYSEQLGISPKRLNQVLLDKVGMTATKLIHQQLIMAAKRSITAAELTIKEISFDLGFTEPTYFSRFFRKQTGLTPEAFREQVQAVMEARQPS